MAGVIAVSVSHSISCHDTAKELEDPWLVQWLLILVSIPNSQKFQVVTHFAAIPDSDHEFM